MIIKTISRTSNVGQLIRYIMREEKTRPVLNRLNSLHRQLTLDNTVTSPSKGPFDRLRVEGVRFTKEDIHWLNWEHYEAKVMRDIKEKCGGDAMLYFEKYVMNKEDLFGSVRVTRNIRSNTVEGYCKEFEANEKFRLHSRKDSVKAFHTVISLHPSETEHLTDKMLRDITKHYIQLRGPSSLFVSAVHKDRDHVHIHCVQSGTQYRTGLSSRISKKEFNEITLAMREMHERQRELYPQHARGLPNFSKEKHSTLNTEQVKNSKRFERASLAESLVKCLDAAYARAKSPDQFKELLREQNIVPYERGKTGGVTYEGYRFRFKTLGYEAKLHELEVRHTLREKTLKEIKQTREGRTIVMERKGRSAGQTLEARPEISDTLRDFKEIRDRVKEEMIKDRDSDTEQPAEVITDNAVKAQQSQPNEDEDDSETTTSQEMENDYSDEPE